MINLPNIPKESFLIIDSSFIPYVVCNPNKVKDEWGEPIKLDGKYVYDDSKTVEDVYAHIDNIFMSIFINLNTNMYLGFIDVGAKNNYRLQINPEYKANRKFKEKPKFNDEAKEYMIEHWGIITVTGLESDDVCNICKHHYPNSTLVSPDKDLYNIEGNCYNPTTNTYITNTLASERRFFATQMIVGDTADNVKGLKGKGDKFAKEFLNKFTEDDFRNNIVLGEIFKLYIEQYGQHMGIAEFNKNYGCLYILREPSEVPNHIELTIPEPIIV